MTIDDLSFQIALKKYEYHMMCPYDKGGALYDGKDDMTPEEKEELKDDLVNMQIDRMRGK